MNLNQYFDFSDRQLKFMAFLCTVLLISGVYLLVRNLSTDAGQLPPLEVYVGESEHVYTGIFMVDPNTSPADSLELLPGIGPVLADRIVAYRRENRFKRTVDITDVKGIGPRLYERIKPYLKIAKC